MEGEIYRFSEVDALNPDYVKYPRAKRVQFHSVVLEAGEVLLVPLGWFHHVLSEAKEEPKGVNVALNLFFDASAEEWEKRKYLKSFKQSYV
jgi:hypothetical protein